MFEPEEKKRKPFSIKTKKIEWASADGRNAYDSSERLSFTKTSKCRRCKRPLTWGDRTYDFDHRDNNPANSSQRNCYLVCKNCHGKVTVVKKRRITGLFGQTVGYETYKKKVGYKKPKKKTKRVPIRDFFGNVTGYRTVRIRKRRATKKRGRKGKKRKTKKRKRK